MAQLGLHLRWESLTYDVAVHKAAPTAKVDAANGDVEKGTAGLASAHAAAHTPLKRILHEVSGQVLPGELLAVMGPSGSGKTSLMKLLACRRPPSGGALLVNGAPMEPTSFKRTSGFVAQTTVCLDTLTVRETIVTTALLRLDRSVPVAQKLKRAEEVIAAIGLLKCADSRIGNDVAGGISGGERRRLSIGVEVVHRPLLLLLDEPTSGLDATSAQMVGDTLRRMSRADGTTSLCTIHQPRASLLAVFDSLLILAEGRTAYFGPVGLRFDGSDSGAGVLAYFSALGYECPRLSNPADWLLDVVNCADAAEQEEADEETKLARRRAVARDFAAKYAASVLAVSAMAPPAMKLQPLPAVGNGTTRFPTSWWTQFAVLWRRTMLYKLREPAAVFTQFSMAVIMPLLVGGIYWNIPLTQTAVTDRLAAMSFLILLQSFMCMDQILLFPKERAVYLRDHATGLHSTSSFFLARTLAEMPFILLFAVISATISYWMYGFQADAKKFFIFVAVIAAVTDTGAAFLSSIGAMSETMEIGNMLATLGVVILTLLDGFYRNLADIPAWVRWVSNFSFLGYGVQAVAANEFRGLAFSCTAKEAAEGCISNGDAYLHRLSMQNTNIGAYIGYVLIIGAGSRFVAYLALRFMYTGQSFRERLAQP